MILENGLSRVYLRVHWIFDVFAVDHIGEPDLVQNVGGVVLGLTIAEDSSMIARKIGCRSRQCLRERSTLVWAASKRLPLAFGPLDLLGAHCCFARGTITQALVAL